MSALLLKLVVRKILMKDHKENIKTGEEQIIALADDVVTMSKRRDILTRIVEKILIEGEKMG